MQLQTFNLVRIKNKADKRGRYMKNRVNTKGIVLAVLAACFYAINAPFSKLLLKTIPSACLAGLLYIGAGAGMFFIMFFFD